MIIPNGNYIVIEGNIGAGKTSLSKMMSEQLNARLILEEFSDNPFLPLFYKNPERYAFPVELFFMTERHKQLQEFLLEGNLFQEYIISDYIFSKTLLFAGQNLEAEELRLFQKLFHTLNASFPKPHLLVYLHRSVDNLMENIKNRGRSYEADIAAEYLQKIQTAYFEFFRMIELETPVLVLDVDGLDFVNNKEDYDMVIEQLNKEYQVGIHYWKQPQKAK
jgi:deoxyadenosine/deoxycytidine kinase